MRRPSSDGFQKKPSDCASHNDRIDGASAFVSKAPTMNVIRQAYSILSLQCKNTIPGTFWLPIVYEG
jgi:hypothetical protein